MRRKLTLLVALVSCACMKAQPAESVSEGDSAIGDTAVAISEVLVTKRLSQREIIAGQRLDGENLRLLSSQSVADALRFFSGVQLKDYGGIGGIKTIDVRAMGSQHVGIAYDGIELGNAQNGQIDLGQFSLDNVESVDLYQGQRSAIFQPASDFIHAANVYIRTRQPRFKSGKDDNFRLTTKYGSSDMFRISGLWEHRLSRSTALSVNSEFLSASGRYKFRYKRKTPSGAIAYDTTATRHNGDITSERVEMNVSGIIHRGFWTTKGYLYHSSRGIPGAIVNNVWRRGERQGDLNMFVQHRFQKDFSDRYSMLVLAKYAFYRTHYENRDTTQLPVDNCYWQQEGYVSTSHVVEIMPQWSASLSYDFRWNKLNADTYRFAYPTRLTNIVALASALDKKIVKLQGSIACTFVNDHLRYGSGTSLHRLTPAAFLSISPWTDGRLLLTAMAKRSFRMPTFNDLYYTDVGNANLRPESANQYDVGLKWNHKTSSRWLTALTLSIDGFYNTVSEKIIAYPKGQQFRWTMLNLGHVHTKGIDVSASATISPTADLSVNILAKYTYQQSRDVTSKSDSYYGDQIPYAPRNSGAAVVNARYKRWSLCYSFIYTGERWDAQENTPANHLQPWYTHDLSAQYEWKAFSIAWRAIAEINNIFNQQYEVVENYPMPGINGRIGLQIEF